MVSSGWNCAAWSKGEQAKVLQLVIVSVSEYRLFIWPAWVTVTGQTAP